MIRDRKSIENTRKVEYQTINIEQFMPVDSKRRPMTDHRRLLELELALRNEMLLRESLSAENESLRSELLNCQVSSSSADPLRDGGQLRQSSGSYVRLHGKINQKTNEKHEDDGTRNQSVAGVIDQNYKMNDKVEELSEQLEIMENKLSAAEERAAIAERLAEELSNKNTEILDEAQLLEDKIRVHLEDDKKDDANIEKLFESIDQLKQENEHLQKRLADYEENPSDRFRKEIADRDSKIRSLIGKISKMEDEGQDHSQSTPISSSSSELQKLLHNIHQLLASTLDTITMGSMLGRIRQQSNRHPSFQIMLLELRTMATSIASETSLLVQKDANQAKKIKLYEENHEKMINNLENLEKELKSQRTKEKEYLFKLEQMEADLARLETGSQSKSETEYNVSPEMIAYLENKLQIQTSVSQIYRGLLEKVLEVLPSNMSTLVSDLAQHLIDHATLTIEHQTLGLPTGQAQEDDWEYVEEQKREAFLESSEKQAYLRNEINELERSLEAMLHNSKISQKQLTENQRKSENIDMEAVRLTRPKSSYLHKRQEDQRPITPVSDHFYRSEAFGDSKTDFALLKSKLMEIKSKII